jgi:hypothetical protein
MFFFFESYACVFKYNSIADGTIGRLAFQETRQNREFLCLIHLSYCIGTEQFITLSYLHTSIVIESAFGPKI